MDCLAIPEVLLKILESRGIGQAELEDFFNPSLSHLEPAESLPGISEAADVILDALAAHRKIVVFGDYDCDGVCATAIVTKTLRALGAAATQVVPFIPERLTEGYGMTDGSVSRLLAEQPDVGLVVTVDNGINAVSQVAGLDQKGIRVVITDHHLPGAELPAAAALVDPKWSAPPALADLCGAGVAFLLAGRLAKEAKRRGLYAGPNFAGPLLVLAGLATVTDVMPLVGQNRILVAEALKRFSTLAPVGLKELHARAARVANDRLYSKDFGFLIGPRINAAGRMASGMRALELVLADNRENARELARIVDAYNVDRKNIEQKMSETAFGLVVADAAAQVIDLPDGHPGVAGIVAARLMEKIGRGPVCVIAGGRGSARSPAGVNVRDAMEACKDLLTRYGGHAAAGGFSVKEGMVDEFRRRLCAYCESLNLPPYDPDALAPDMWVEASDLSLELADWVQKCEPFGEGNPEPVFGLKRAFLTDVHPLGTDGRHLSLTVRASATTHRSEALRAVWWMHGDLVEELRRESGEPHDLTFTLDPSDYGERHLELRLTGLRRSAAT